MNLPIVRPMLAVTAPRLFVNKSYRYETKWRGIRCIAYHQGETVLRGRRDDGVPPSITHRFPEIRLETVGGIDAILDGELVVMKDGKPDQDSIQERSTDGRLAINIFSKTMPAQYHVFDILRRGNVDLTPYPYIHRKQLLYEVVKENGTVAIEPSYIDGEELFASIVEQGLEGIMAKAIDSRYTPGVRSPYWEKIKPLKTERLWAYGMTRGTGSRNLTFGALILGEYRRVNTGGYQRLDPKDQSAIIAEIAESFHYVGCVGSGFSDKDIAEWVNKAQPQGAAAYTPLSVGPVLRFFKPEPIMVSYFDRTEGGLLCPRVAKQ